MVTQPRFDGRRVLVVGATGGIGSLVSRLLAEAGARLLLVARTEDRLEALARELNAAAAVMDATNPAGLERLLADHDTLHGAVNLVGSIVLKPAHRTAIDEWHTTVGLNLSTAFYLVRAVAPKMRRKGGSIVLMSSAAGRVGLANHDAIGAAKAGVEGLARSAAASYAGQAIRVNAVAPGLVRTQLAQSLVNSPQGLAASQAMHPIGRIGEADDVASVVTWLLSDAASWITGQVMGVDGGMSTVRGRVRA